MQSINYTTFYSYKIINRNSVVTYYNTYVGIWTDGDLGYAGDDYVGCNVSGDYCFTYNGDSIDEGVNGYGTNPPMIDVALLKGPAAEPGDGIDNNHNGVV